MSVLGVIPARYNSKRLPGKPLARIVDRTMVQMVYEKVWNSNLIDELIVATDDKRIFEHVQSFGGKAVLTPEDLPSGTDRVAYVAKSHDCEIVANIQGDEPFISYKLVDKCIEELINDSHVDICTLARTGILQVELLDPDVVKVLVDRRSNAIYFSRANIPYKKSDSNIYIEHPTLVHIGLYVYRKDFLMKYVEMSVSTLEQMEQLEQLRILENGYRIRVVKTDVYSIGVDTKEDLERAERALKENEI